MTNWARLVFTGIGKKPESLLAFMALAYAMLSGLRLPNIWSVTHYLFDYSAGFIKRGLFGEILTPLLGHSVHYGVLALLCYAIVAIWLVMFFVRVQAIARFDRRIWLLVAVVLVSPGFVFLFHEIGYFDHISLIVVLACFLMPIGLLGLLGRISLCVIMILIHETFFVLFVPAIVVEYWVRGALAGQSGTLLGVALLVASTAAVTYAMVQTTLSVERQAAYLEHIASRAADFEIRPTAVKVLFRDRDENFSLNAQLWKNRKRWVDAFAAAVFLLPLPFALIAIFWNLLYRMDLPKRTKVSLGFGASAGALSPLFLNVIAWDLWRFFCLVQVSSLMMLLAVIGRTCLPLFPDTFAKPAKYGLVVFGVFGAATATPLFDDYVVEKPPYVSLINYAIDAAQGDIPWFSIPKR